MTRPPLEMESILYSPRLVQQQRDGVCLLIDPEAPNWASANALGSKVLRRCDGRWTLAEVARELQSEHGLPATGTAAFVRQAVEAGLLATTPDVSPAYPGRGRAIACDRLEELWVHTNNSCPLRCRHCLVNGGVEESGPMPGAEIQGVVDQALGLGATRVYFTGGDPLMREDLLSLVDYVTQRAQLVVLTSGVLLSEQKVAGLRRAGRGRLLMQVSLEGPNAETNDAIRGAGNFARAVAGIERLVAAGLTPIVTTTVTRLNHTRVGDTTRFLASLGVKDHHILWLHGRGRMRQDLDGLLLAGPGVAQVMAGLRQAARESGVIVDNRESLRVRVRSGRGRKNDLCHCCFGALAVHCDGHVYPCAALCGAPGFDCGSLREGNLKDIWLRSPVAAWIRENSVQKRVGCSSCYLKFFCGGGCFAQSYFDYEMRTGQGCIMAPDPYCEAYRSQLVELMWEEAMPRPDERSEDRPLLYRAMGTGLPACAADGSRVLDAAFNVGTYHCACVLAMDVEQA